MPEPVRILSLLGNPPVAHAGQFADVVAIVRSGLPVAILPQLMKHLGLSQQELAEVTGIPRRTLVRRLQGEERLKPEESNKLYRLARIALLAEETLGDEDKARRWLSKPNRALGGEAPIKLLDTDAGTEEVENVLGRIAGGVYS